MCIEYSVIKMNNQLFLQGIIFHTCSHILQFLEYENSFAGYQSYRYQIKGVVFLDQGMFMFITLVYYISLGYELLYW